MASVLTPPPVEAPEAVKAVEEHVRRPLQSAQFAGAGNSLITREPSNVIVLGNDPTLQSVREYTDTSDFKLSRGGHRVMNAKPRGNESRAFLAQNQGKERRIEPSIIAVLLGRANSLKVLMLESRDTSVMISLLCSKAGEHSVETL